MTKKELSQLYNLNREIELETKRLKEFEQESNNISGLPHIDILANASIAAQIEDCKTIIDAKQRAAVAEYNRLMRYIASIDDSLTRQIISLRYVNGFNWTQVAMHIGGGNTADSVRMVHNRFLSIGK